MKTYFARLLAALALFAVANTVVAQGTTAFTYQGQLHDSGTNANGNYTMIFSLYTNASGGTSIAGPITTNAILANGLFSVNLDFGNAFSGSARFLDITVTNGGTAQELSPRVQILPAPYALYAAVAATVTNGAIMNAQLSANAVATTNIQNNAITTAQIADGAVTNQNLAANAVMDTNIVSVSGSKVSGVVANAANLTNGTWNASVGIYQTYPNIFTVSDAGTIVMALYSVDDETGAQISGNLGVSDEIDIGGDNSGSITGDGNGGLILSDLSVGSSGDGNISFGNATGVNDISFSGGSEIQNSGNGSIFINSQGHGVTIQGASIISADNSASLAFGTGGLNLTGFLTVSGNIVAPGFNSSSDRNLKEKFAPINSQEILSRVVSMPITSWNFKTDTIRHIGPMAQDFYGTFNIGTDDKHIGVLDEGGVALAAIQGLNQKVDKKDAELEKLKSQNESLEKRLADLEKLVKQPMNK